jgi:preprotein translocase subunit SecF
MHAGNEDSVFYVSCLFCFCLSVLFYRTLFIWMVSLFLGWESFSWIQVIGFVVMVTGTFYFNGVLKWPFVKKEDQDERTPLLRNQDSEQ